MPRPKCQRRIGQEPVPFYFKPRGVPLSELEVTVLATDEVEAVRLADFERLYHEAAAARMGISRATFGRILDSAHHKIAGVVIHGRALRLEGREATMPQARTFTCMACGHQWELPYGTGRPAECPECKSGSIERLADEHGTGRRGRGVGCALRGRRIQRRARIQGQAGKEPTRTETTA